MNRIKFILLASLLLVVTFTVSCSDGGNSDNTSSSSLDSEISSSEAEASSSGTAELSSSSNAELSSGSIAVLSSSSIAEMSSDSSDSSSSGTAEPSSSSIAEMSSSSSHIVSCNNSVHNPGTHFCDTRDGKIYRWVEIGSQIWMAENLNYDVPNDATDMCYDNDPANCATYGRLYNRTTVMNGAIHSVANPSGIRGICPPNWHLPSDEEWNVLVKYVDPITWQQPAYTTAGTKLKSASGWLSGGNGTDVLGFSAKPGGYGDGSNFSNIGHGGYWWSATMSSRHYTSLRRTFYKQQDVDIYNSSSSMFSVRCVQNF